MDKDDEYGFNVSVLDTKRREDDNQRTSIAKSVANDFLRYLIAPQPLLGLVGYPL